MKCNRGETVFDGLPATKGASADAALSSPSDAYGATSPWRGGLPRLACARKRSFPARGRWHAKRDGGGGRRCDSMDP